jgi:hypothetical protein
LGVGLIFQQARAVQYHPKQCPKCRHFIAPIRRCEAWSTPSWPSPLLAYFQGETDAPCSRFAPSPFSDTSAEPAKEEKKQEKMVEIVSRKFVVGASTVEEAKKLAEGRLPADAMEVEFKVLDSGSKGFMGIGKKPAQVEVSYKTHA